MQERVIDCYEAIEYGRPVRDFDEALSALRLVRAALAAAAPGETTLAEPEKDEIRGNEGARTSIASDSGSASAAPGETEQTP